MLTSVLNRTWFARTRFAPLVSAVALLAFTSPWVSASALEPASPNVVVKPTVNTLREGIYDTSTAPPDANIAAGTDRLIQTANLRVGVYTTSLQSVSSFPLWQLLGRGGPSPIGDPQGAVGPRH